MDSSKWGASARLMSFDNNPTKFQEWLEERQQAHQRVGAVLIELVENETLSVVEAGIAYASVGAAIDGYHELVQQGSPGTSFGIEQLIGGRSPVATG